MFLNDPNALIIYGLVFLLGVLIGLFLTAGGRKKWKTRYHDEVSRHDALQREHKERTREWEAREKELVNRPVVAPVVVAAPAAAATNRDLNRDGVVDADEAARTRRPAGGLIDKVLGRDRDRDGDGVPDRDETATGKIDRNRDGIDDRDQ